MDQRLYGDVCDETDTDTEDDTDERTDMSAEFALHDATDERGGTDRHCGGGQVSEEASPARTALSWCSAARGAVGDHRSCDLSEGDK